MYVPAQSWSTKEVGSAVDGVAGRPYLGVVAINIHEPFGVPYQDLAGIGEREPSTPSAVSPTAEIRNPNV